MRGHHRLCSQAITMRGAVPPGRRRHPSRHRNGTRPWKRIPRAAPHVLGRFLVGFVDEPGQRTPREVSILVLHRLDARSINRQKLPPVQVELPAQDDELTEYLFKDRPVHTTEIGVGAEVGLQVLQ